MDTHERSEAPDSQAIRTMASEHLSFEDLRPGQEEALRSVIAGTDTLAVLPTGAGKSAIYQLAGAAIDGSTVVVSPLVALQRDQLRLTDDQDVGESATANSYHRRTSVGAISTHFAGGNSSSSSWRRSSSMVTRSLCSARPT